MSVLTPSTSIRSEVLLLYAARGVRGFADGFAVIILPAYLSAIGLSPAEIGIVATTALLGSSLLTLTAGFMAPRPSLVVRGCPDAYAARKPRASRPFAPRLTNPTLSPILSCSPVPAPCP